MSVVEDWLCTVSGSEARVWFLGALLGVLDAPVEVFHRSAPFLGALVEGSDALVRVSVAVVAFLNLQAWMQSSYIKIYEINHKDI